MCLNQGYLLGRKDDYPEATTLHILLVGQPLVTSDKYFEAHSLQFLQQLPISQTSPTHIYGCANVMTLQQLA